MLPGSPGRQTQRWTGRETAGSSLGSATRVNARGREQEWPGGTARKEALFFVSGGGGGGVAFLSCIGQLLDTGCPWKEGVTLGETVVFNQYNPQRRWAAEAYQLTTFVASGGVSFPFPKEDPMTHHRVLVHRLPEGPLSLLCTQG